MSEEFRQQRCAIYPDRVAVARCPECGLYFSRECITEHEGRLICATCLEKLAKEERPEGRGFHLPLVPWLEIAAAGIMVWVLYYALARLLIMIPSEFHEGSIWTN